MKLKVRRVSVFIATLIGVLAWLVINPESYDKVFTQVENTGAEEGLSYVANDEGTISTESVSLVDGVSSVEVVRTAASVLEKLEVKGRAPKTGYSREQFYNGWPTIDGCSLRQ